MSELQSQSAPTAPIFQKDFTFIYECRIPKVDCICLSPDPIKKKKGASVANETPRPKKKNCTCSVFDLEKQSIESVENRSCYDPSIKHVTKRAEISVEVRMSPQEDMSISQVYNSLGKSRRIIIPEARILQIIKSSTKKCLEVRNQISLSPTKTINFFVKQKIRKGDGERIFVFRLKMTKSKKFDVTILSLKDPEIIKGEDGQLWAVDHSLKS